MRLAELITLSVKHNASDLHLCSGDFPRWRCRGVIQTVPGYDCLPQGWFEQFCNQKLDSRAQQQLKDRGHYDFTLNFESAGRVRAAIFWHRKGLSLALRILSGQIPQAKMLGLPSAIYPLLSRPQGLLLITGATGAGKSTTLAALIGTINQQQHKHIITLEDPVEFLHDSQLSLIQQREVGHHLPDFFQGLQAALRQDPDIIVLGELRDQPMIQLALAAAQTGHLVLATLHTASAAQAPERLTDVFPAADREVIRAQLAQTLSGVLSQCLEVAGTGRIALFELLINTPAVAGLIREGRTHQLQAQMEMGLREGMQTFTQSRQQRITEGWLTEPVLSAKNVVAEPLPVLTTGVQTSFPK